MAIEDGFVESPHLDLEAYVANVLKRLGLGGADEVAYTPEVQGPSFDVETGTPFAEWDPYPQYLRTVELNERLNQLSDQLSSEIEAVSAGASVEREQANGVAGLDAGGKLFESRLPDRLTDASLETVLGGRGVSVKAFGAVGNGGADDTAAIQNAVNAVVAAGGGLVFFPPGTYKITTRIYINSTGTSGGVETHGITLMGTRGASRIDATAVNVALSFGKRSVAGNSQADGISNGVICADLELVGAGVEFWGCQRDSAIRNVRVDLTGATAATRGIYCLFSSTLQLLQTRVDNGGDNIDGITLDTCSDAFVLGGGANYCRKGLTVEALLGGSNRTTSLTVRGFHTEGDRREHYDLQAVGSADLAPHVVTSTEWNVTYPLIHIGSNAGSSCVNVKIRGGYITGSGPGGTTGVAIKSDRSTDALVDGTRIVNVGTGIERTANDTGLEIRRPRIETVVTPYVDNGPGGLRLPGSSPMMFCTQAGATLAANQTVSLTIGGIASATATRTPLLKAGSVIGIALRINATLTAGTLTVKVQKNTVDVAGCQLVKGTGGSGNAGVWFVPLAFPFANTDDIRVQITTSSDYAVGTAVVPVVLVGYLPD